MMNSIRNLKAALVFTGAAMFTVAQAEPKPRGVVFIGIDVSGSFRNSGHFEDSLDFVSTYIYSHLNGLGGLEKPASLFVAEIGGNIKDEAKTFYPIQTFENRNVAEIEVELKKIFSKPKDNLSTDFNAFFESVAGQVKARKLLLRPMTILLISDGKPDFLGKGSDVFSKIDLKPIENLSRNITVRLLYTDAVTASHWQKDVQRNRVKIWTQDAPVMRKWRDPKIFQDGLAIDKQERFFSWLFDNVDFGVRKRQEL
jgi:hypothetical protein